MGGRLEVFEEGFKEREWNFAVREGVVVGAWLTRKRSGQVDMYER